MEKEIGKVAVIGAGRMGHGIAETFIRAGKEVFLCDVSMPLLREAVAFIEQELAELSDWGAMPSADIQPIMDRLHLTTVLEQAVSDADVVIEAVPEDLELKKQVFKNLDAACPERTILVSNSSFFGPSEYGSTTKRQDRIAGAHYFYPPHLVPLVEVVRSESTSDGTVKTMCDLLESSGKTALVVQKEVRGFIANRLQYALQREAFYLVEQGICSAKDIDLATKTSYGLRMPFAGIVENLEMSGSGNLEMLERIWEFIFPHLCASKEPLSLFFKKLKSREIGSKTSPGFYDWTPESKDARRKEVRRDLFKLLQTLTGKTGNA